jgi:hypothetical protein
MSNLDQIIDYTKLFQDVELATAIGQLKKDPSQLQQFLQDQQGKVFSDVIKQKDSTFQKVYGDLNRASEAQESILMLDKRNKELAQIQQQIYDNQKNSADAITSDKNLAGRKYEMNEWSVNNKKETLFIMTMLFIALSALTLITVLWRMGLMSSILWGGLAAPIIIIFTLVLINRTQYTDIFRNKRYWNRKIFEGKYGKIPTPLCPTDTSVQNELQSLKSDIQVSINNTQNTMTKGISSAITENTAPASIPAAAPITN